MRDFLNKKVIALPKRSKQIILLMLFFGSSALHAQTVINLYNGDIPGAIKADYVEVKEVNQDSAIFVSKVSNPTLTIFLPSGKHEPTSAVIICPGGGYGGLSMTSEGTDVAELFTKNGVAAFVLKYRLPSDKVMTHKETGPMQDAQEAMVVLRKNAKKWNLDINKIGVMGFSAGGHLAATVGTHFSGVIKDETHASLRPDFMILLYPVISMTDSLTHGGSRYNLLGKTPAEETKRWFSNELQVSKVTPPTFIMAAEDDPVVSPKNSLVFYQALLQNKIPAEIHIYQKGGHGFGLENSSTKDKWFERCINWMQVNRWISIPSVNE